jgi:hypothetical protein
VPGEFSATMTSKYGGERCGRKREIREQEALVASGVNLQRKKGEAGGQGQLILSICVTELFTGTRERTR